MARKCLEGECWSLAAGAGPGVNVTVSAGMEGMWHQIFLAADSSSSSPNVVCLLLFVVCHQVEKCLLTAT